MNYKMIVKGILICSLSFFQVSSASAQTFNGAKAGEMVKGASEVRVDQGRKSVSFVRLEDGTFVSASSPEQWLLSTVLKGRPEDGLLKYQTESDKIGYTHSRYRQVYKNIPVEFSMYIVHARDGKVVSVNGEYYPGINISTQASVTSEQALQAAKNYIGATRYKPLSETNIVPELVVLRTANQGYKLAYKTDVYADEPMSRNWVYVDAQTNEVIYKLNRIHTVDVPATAVTNYSGTRGIMTDSVAPSNYRLREAVRGAGNGTITRNLQGGSNYSTATDFTNTSTTWPAGYDNSAADAHFGAEKTYDYYYSNYGHNSFDNAGGTILSYVHYSTNYVNAFWDGTEMTYGDGDGVQYSPLTSLEIVGHEITHGVTERSAGLIYSGESGALNESFSDVFGNTIRFINNPSTATWYCGDQIVISGGGATPFRNLANPNDFNCADTYGGTYWNYGDVVHYDSGVQNFWYYLLSTGGTGTNDNGDAYTVNGIGLTDAGAIAFRNLTVYLTPSSTFADARTYAIQSALDLFGSCSNQVIQTTNAWYAVGVGGVFSNAVVASFNATQNYFCVAPATAYFTNNSVNGTSFSWTFGDGGTSTATSPSHVYTNPGLYSVTLIASGTASCGNTDTVTYTNYITVTNTGGPISPACTPTTTAACCGIGITRVQMNTLNNTSGNSTEGYKDFTCNSSTTLTAGDPYPVTITTGFTNAENVKIWIDYNNDGTFNNTNELAFTSNNHIATHTGVIHTPTTAVLGTPLRMRVMDDAAANAIATSCTNSQNGQAEDYTVTFEANTLPPLADFIASDTVVNVGSTIVFNDLTIHAPTSWQWTFTGGSPASSTVQNPSVTYSAVGDYTVTLQATNGFGTNSITKTMYIHVVNYIYLCTATSTTAANGLLYDSGGPTGNYQNSENCSLLISPVCASSITLSFSTFQTENGFDYLRVYDGTNASGTLLMNLSGTSSPAPVTATSGSMFISWSSDGSVIYSGIAASWASVITSSSPPVADFVVQDPTPPLATAVQFTDQSTNSPVAWSWDFGDGGTSTQQNPTHAYAASGPYNITLIAYTCNQSDTITKSLTVQNAPSASANPDTLTGTAACGGTATVQFTISNGGPGELVYTIGGSHAGPIEILACSYGSDVAQEYPNTLAAINQYFTNYNLTDFPGLDPVALQAALVGKDVLLFPEQENSTIGAFQPLGAVVQAFASNGGTVVVCGSYSGYADRIFDMGLFTGSYLGFGPPGLTTLDTTDAITNNVPLSFSGPDATYYVNITNSDKVKLVEYSGSGYDVVTYRTLGTGKIIYLGFDYYATNNAASQLAANCVSIGSSSVPSWISVSPDHDTLSASGTSVVTVTFSTAGLFAGTYTSAILVQTNDPLNPILTIPCIFTVTGNPAISLSDTCFDFGTVVQYTTTTDTLVVTNSGCDSLRITGYSSTAAQFSTSTGTIIIPPYSSANVLVNFNPLTIGSFSGLLHIYNNAIDTVICLSGSAASAPAIVTNPTSFNVNLGSCSDSVTLPLTIYNTGGTNLTYTISGAGSSGSTTEILALTYGTDLSTEYPNTLAAISQFYTNFNLTTIASTNPSDLQTALVGKNIFLMTEPETGTPSVYTGFASVLQNFVNSGGVVIMCGAYDLQSSCILNTGLFSGTWGMSATGSMVNVVNNTTPLTTGLPSTFVGSDGTFVLNISNADKVKLIDYAGMDVVTYRPIGSGYAVFIAFDYFNYATEQARLIANTIQWAAEQSFSSWLSVSSSSGTVTPGGNNLVYVTFNSGSLSGGTYQTNIIIHSNDPLIPDDTIPCTLNVSYAPCANFTYTSSVCSGIFQFTSNTINSPTSYAWDFGDGGTSNVANPAHNFISSGVYTVQLIVCNGSGCDTLSQTLNIGTVGGPVTPACAPVTTGYCCSIGIYNVSLANINNTSNDGVDGYMDYTCTDTTTLFVNNTYAMAVQTGPTYTEDVVAWIDYNNDGSFGAGEEIFNSQNVLQFHTGMVTIPSAGVVLNTPLRMRVGSDYSGSLVPQSCTPPDYGQFEDYTVYLTIGVSVPELPGLKALDVYPNPFTEQTSIEYTLTAAGHVTIEVYNVIGEKVTTVVSNQLQAPGKYSKQLHLPQAGVYFVNFTTDDGTVVRRVVKMN